MPEPVRTVGELMQLLSQLDPQMPLLVDGYEGGFTEPVLSRVEVQELAGLGWFYGRFMPPDEAAQRTGPRGPLRLVRDGAPPVLVGEPFAAVVLRRIERRDED